MSEIRDKVDAKLDQIILEAIEKYMGDWDEAIAEAKAQILSIDALAVVDRKAKLPGIFTNTEELKSILRYEEELANYVKEVRDGGK